MTIRNKRRHTGGHRISPNERAVGWERMAEITGQPTSPELLANYLEGKRAAMFRSIDQGTTPAEPGKQIKEPEHDQAAD